MDGKNLLTSLATSHFNQQYRNASFGNALKSAQHRTADAVSPGLRDACQEMESLFLTYLLKEMRATVDKSGFISGGQAEEIFTSMLDVELSKKLSAAGGIGLSSMLFEQLGGNSQNKKSADSK